MPLEHCRREVEGWLELKLTSGRCSGFLVDELAHHMLKRTLDVFAIYDEIGGLEGAPFTHPRSTKPASAFRGKVLKGLWHKHYSTPAFLVRNLLNHWTPDRLTALASEVAADETIPTDKRGNFLAHRLVLGGHEERHRQGRVTGEWIVFVKGPSANTYLTLAGHSETDEAIRARADQAAAEFHDLQL
jgi:hypothetical protein